LVPSPSLKKWARLELNQHALAGTRPSTLRVCQFRHEPNKPAGMNGGSR
jgi:hypothetical protein